MRNGIAVLAVVLLVGLTTAGHSKNKHLLDAVQKRMTSLSHQAKRLFVKSDGEHALWQKLAAGAGLALITCTSMSCGATALRGNWQEQQHERSTEEIIGRHVHFVSEGQDYVGYVDDALAADEVSIDLYDGKVMSAKTHQVRGIRIETHPDEDQWVYIASEEEGKQYLFGMVGAVYDNNKYEVMVGGYVDHSNNMQKMESFRVVIVDYRDLLDTDEYLERTASAPEAANAVFIAFLLWLLIGTGGIGH